MQNETSGENFRIYGSVYREAIHPEQSDLIRQTAESITHRYVTQLHMFDCDAYLQVQSGIGVLLVSNTPNLEDVQEFAMNRLIHLKPNVYFAVVSTTPRLTYDLLVDSAYTLTVVDLPTPYEYLAVLPRIEIKKILGHYYRMRTPNYLFKGEQHDFFELTYIDSGELHTTVDNVDYLLKEKDLILYGPGQFHTQYTDDSHDAAYITILFDMCNLTPVEQSVWYENLVNRVFHYDQKIDNIIKDFVRESTTGIPYMNSLMLCLLTEIIIRLLQGTYASPTAHAVSSGHQSAMDELFSHIIAYIDDNICEPMTIPQICEHFSLSRSALQLMFKKHVDQSPKKYINDRKLEYSCQLLLDGRSTISQVSLQMGYNSIHYFSKAFNTKYNMSPSKFIKLNTQAD